MKKDFDAPAASPIFHGRKATFRYKNIECSLYPQGEDADAQVARFADVTLLLQKPTTG